MSPEAQQFTEDFQTKLSRLNNYLWGAGLKDPVTRIQQVSFLFFLKMLEEQDNAMERAEELTGRAHHSIFEGDNEKFRWSRWRDKTGTQLYNFVRDNVFQFAVDLQNSHTTVSQIFRDAKFLIPDEVTLKRAVEIIDSIEFSKLETDVKGDLYEGLLQSIDAAGELGQFLTPRHIIRPMVHMVNPKIGESVFDPACGTGGFLIASFEWIKYQNSSKESIAEKNGYPIGYGDRLKKAQWDFLIQKTFHGYDVDPEMMRLCLMNLILHGIEGAKIQRKDTVAGSETDDDLRQFDVVLTNPPFAGKVDLERVKPTLPVKSKKTQVLFLGYVLNALKPGTGRAGIILPEGSLFGTNRDDKEIRRYLLENTKLEAVVSMPAGVFQPYAGVKTSFLVFRKKNHPEPVEGSPDKIWFFNMQGDGSSLSAAKKYGPQYRNDIPKLLELWNGGQPKEEKGFSWFTPVKQIAANDFILSANTYNPHAIEAEKPHRDPKEILGEIEQKSGTLDGTREKIAKLLGGS
ncbi:MAG: N-6 DNA methylase [Candidatus Wildermuthbacteria bacterium]|nr:N-6 DNA methylase [Candidatus Wildermuthbacteria bacterium]